ncbi:DUF2690 domain-containing protein [Streptomyces sp. NPDC006134]|uniref:helix-turn-helix domain-containing protein n=1 Tax=Streptomyces sp. NPDC006134 TaxID=3154467 RepID=UPI0033E6D6CB
MPRWKALPDELDPQIREFAGQLRRLVDRSGLSIAAVADRTGYSKTSWERYLNGRLLAPKGAIVALAEVTETNPVHLTTMWELAERAWSRSEMRHDMTMEAIRISQARAALGELAAPSAGTQGSRGARRGGRGVPAAPGIAGPAGVAPTVPPVPAQPTASESPDALGGRPRGGDVSGASSGTSSASSGASSGGNSWGVAGYRGPSPAAGRAAGGAPGGAAAAGAPGRGIPAAGVTGAAGAYGEPPREAVHQAGRAGRAGGRRMTTFLAGVVGVLVVIAGAFFLLDGGGKDDENARTSPSPTASTAPDLPAGVKCSGDLCTGKDAEVMGCSGDLVTTARQITVGTALVEVRYSKTCGAAWGRVTQAGQGDEVQVSAGGARQTGAVTEAGDTIAYTPMVAVKKAGDAVACVTLASGQKGCTD